MHSRNYLQFLNHLRSFSRKRWCP